MFASISFPIPLETGLDGAHVHFINSAGEEVHLGENASFEPEVKTTPQPNPAPCPGTSAAPEAAAGELCVYEGRLSGPAPGNNEPVLANELIGKASDHNFPPLSPFNLGADPSGALLNVRFLSPPGIDPYGFGTWAVTAAE